MRNDFESNYLAHHGILGQKWGKKNGPPYPLDAGDHSSSEKKAGWRESLEQKKQERHKHKQQKALAKDIKKATKKSYTTKDAEKSIGSLVRDKLTYEQRQTLYAKKKKMESDKNKDTKEYSKKLNEEYKKRFGKRKPSESELEKLHDDISEKMINSKSSEASYKSWDDYIKYSRSITDELIGKYGDTKLKNLDIAKYNTMINRILDNVGETEDYKSSFKEWNNAESKWYWNTDKKSSGSLGKKEKELREKSSKIEETLREKGYSEKELRKYREEALAEDPSYHKYEDEYYKKRRA